MYKFNLLVKSREGTLFDGVVASVSSYNKKGKFDVLPQHANFISLIKNKLIIRELGGAVRELPVTNGLMRVRKDNVEIYVGIESLASNVEGNGDKL
jgi:F0F1-type ATP synthase epsilon subunit